MKTNQTTDKATARPWTTKLWNLAGCDVIKVTTEDYEVDFRAAKQTGESVAELPLNHHSKAQNKKAQANAALIVKAVNEHAALVAVASATAYLVERVEGCKELDRQALNLLVADIDKTLANLASVRAESGVAK